MPCKYDKTKPVAVNASMDQQSQDKRYVSALLEQSLDKQPATGPKQIHHEPHAFHPAAAPGEHKSGPRSAAMPHSSATSGSADAWSHTYSGDTDVAEAAKGAYEKASMLRWRTQPPSDEPWNVFRSKAHAEDVEDAYTNHKKT